MVDLAFAQALMHGWNLLVVDLQMSIDRLLEYSTSTSIVALKPLYTEFHFLEVLLRLLISCMISISTSAIS